MKEGKCEHSALQHCYYYTFMPVLCMLPDWCNLLGGISSLKGTPNVYFRVTVTVILYIGMIMHAVDCFRHLHELGTIILIKSMY